MTGERSYGDQCGVARSLDVVGERWALLIVRELLLGPRRFNDLLAGLPGASPNVISTRLRELAEHGVVRRHDLGPPTRVRLYELTEWGRELEPVILHLGQWGQQAPLPEGAQVGLDSVLLAIQGAARPAGPGGRFELHIGADVFTADTTSGTARIRRGRADQPAATLTTDGGTFRALAFGQRPLADALAAGDLQVDGPAAAVRGLEDLLLTLASSGEASATG